ncbi:MAG: hypothetical protein KAS32_16615 [Candidatus Peribacteraceae bacterium]|nr:hypothetical protein [Candidatus Peribacteraceae bacterium]
MCISKSQELPYEYVCALCGERKIENHEQWVSICPECMETPYMNVMVGWEDKD